MVEWDKIANKLKKKGEAEFELWGWSLLNSSLIIRDALKRRGLDNRRISLNFIDNDSKVRVTLTPEVKEKKRKGGK